jgi:DNA-binding FadR family transcriptional regulator
MPKTTKNTAPLSSQVEEKLLQYIKDNKLEVGAKLPNEATLSKTFSVGRSSLREATSRLVSRGVLEVRQGSGTFILDPIPSDKDPLGLRFEKDHKKISKDLLSLLLHIEPHLASEAAKSATDDEIKKIERAAKNSEMTVEFHSLIAKASKNCLSENLIALLYSTTDIFENNIISKGADEYAIYKSKIVEALKRHDEFAANLSMIELIHAMYSASI